MKRFHKLEAVGSVILAEWVRREGLSGSLFLHPKLWVLGSDKSGILAAVIGIATDLFSAGT